MIFDSFPDGYLVDGLLVFGGPNGGYVAMGFLVELPDLQTASFAERNRTQDLVVTLLRQLPEGWSLQCQVSQTAGDGARLLAYQQDTERCTNPTARLLRNTNFVAHWDRLEQSRLRQRRVVLFVGRPLVRRGAPALRRAAERLYTEILAEARTSFRQWGQAIEEITRSIGGRCSELADADLARLWANTLNPSYAARLDYDPVPAYDLERSLLDNCWHSELRGQGRQGFMLDGWHHVAFSLKRAPTETYFTLIYRLTHLPFGDFTITVHLRRLNMKAVLERTQASLDRIHRQLERMPNPRLSVAQAQFEEKSRRLASGEAIPFEMEFIVLVRARTEDELAARVIAIKNGFHGMNGAQYYEATLPASARNLFVQTLPGWVGSLRHSFVHYIEDRSAADLLPLCGSFSGHPGPVEALFHGAEDNLVNVVTFLGDGPAATPQHLIVLGATGTGKSLVITKVLIETGGDYHFTGIVEEGLSQAPYTRSFGVEPFVFRLDGTQTLNPFGTPHLILDSALRASITGLVARMVGLPADEEQAHRRCALIARHVASLFADHACDQLRQWPEARRRPLLEHAFALDRLATQKSMSEVDAFYEFREWQQADPEAAAALLAQPTDNELLEFESTHPTQVQNLLFAHLEPHEHLTLSSLREHFELAVDDVDECRWLATLLAPWCRGGNCGVLFDGVSNVQIGGPVVHFELGLIPEAAREIKTAAGFLIINGMRQFILSLSRSQRKRIVIEEVSRFLDVPGGEAILRELFEQFRKHRTQVTIVGQSYSRIADSPIRAALVGNARAWFIFNTGDRRDIERLAQDLGLSRAAQETILRFPRPDQQRGAKYSEFLYWHTDERQPVCGPVRYFLLPHALPTPSAPAPTTATPLNPTPHHA